MTRSDWLTFTYADGTNLEAKDPGARAYAERVGREEGYGPIIEIREGRIKHDTI